MKKLLITLEYPPDVGGIATYYENLVKGSGDIEALHLKASPKKFAWLGFFKAIWRTVKKQKIERLLIGHVLPLGYFGLFFKLFYGKPYTVYVHGVDVLQRLSLLKRLMIRMVLVNADSVVANSRYVAEKTIARYGIASGKIRVEYPCIDVQKIEKEAREVPDVLRGDKKIVLSVGRLVERKGFDKVIEAMGMGEVCYWIIGEGPDRPRLESLVKKHNLCDRVKFLGVVPAPQIYAYYRACDVFVMPSREIDGDQDLRIWRSALLKVRRLFVVPIEYSSRHGSLLPRISSKCVSPGDVEGFGIVFLEAGVFKKPVIGGRSGGVPEAVVDGVTGLLVEPKNVDDIARALAHLLADEMLSRRLGEGGYERVKREFSLAP